MLRQIVFLLAPLVAFSLDSNSKCICPPPPACQPSPALCSNVTGKRIVEKIQTGKLKLRKVTGTEEQPFVHVEGEARSHLQKRSTSLDSIIPDDDSDLIAPTGQNQRFTRKTNKQASSANAVKEASRSGRSNPAANGTDVAVDIKCNSQVLKKLMLENIGDNSSVSKRAINDRAEAKFGGSVDVVCSRGHFSYVYSSNLYCEATKGDITCIAFRQSH